MFLEVIKQLDNFFIFGILLSQLLRWSVSRWPYSGAGKPPMFGDYEAQRHWMEITINLPVRDWYKNTTQNDLQYWGLDYPPLTAYQSWLFGRIAKLYDPNWVALNSSRGFESYEHKIFMRSTVVAIDLLTFYIPVILYWLIIARPAKFRDKAIATGLTLLYPGLILIDHGHFQYNCASLGLTVSAVVCLLVKYDLAGAVFFTMAIHYKQMSLYYALPFFGYLFGRCLQKPLFDGSLKFVNLSLAVIITSIICWAPFVSRYETFQHVVSRMFPVSRGLYEDKVANVWCALSIIIKFKAWFSLQSLVILSAITTLLMSLPSSIHLLRKPSLHAFRLALVNCSLVFFLFSYQVHEKSILLCTLPALLLIEDHPFACSWFLHISTFSLVPLLAKDGLIIPYLSLSILFFAGLWRAYDGFGLSLLNSKVRLKTVTFSISVMGCLCLIISMYTIKQPKHYPHLHVLLNCIYSCGHFVAFAVYFHWLQFVEKPWLLYKPKKKYL